MKWIVAAIMVGLAVLMTPVSYVAAQSPEELACRGSGGIWRNGECVPSSGQSLTDIIANVINLLLFMVGVLAVIAIIIGGIRFITANGDSSKITAARQTILYAVVGLIVAIAAFAIVNFVLDRF